jgi:hypothetical protein
MAKKPKPKILTSDSPESPTPAPAVLPPVRTEAGRFPAGVSGNPNGRPLGKRNEITDVQQSLELAIRKGISSSRIQKIVDELITKAEGGSLQAARLILDKVLPNAKTAEDSDSSIPSIVIRIENATSGAKTVTGETYDGQVLSPAINEG